MSRVEDALRLSRMTPRTPASQLWREPAGLPGFATWGELTAHVHKGMRSRGGVPLNGGEAHAEGFGLDACPYEPGSHPSPYWYCWRNEWHAAARSSNPAGGAEAPAQQQGDESRG